MLGSVGLGGVRLGEVRRMRATTQDPMSGPEAALKAALARAEIPYSFQHSTRSGYIIDFAFPEARLAVEVDGSAWHSSPRQRSRDGLRTHRLKLDGWTVVRFHADLVVRSPDVVVAALKERLRLNTGNR